MVLLAPPSVRRRPAGGSGDPPLVCFALARLRSQQVPGEGPASAYRAPPSRAMPLQGVASLVLGSGRFPAPFCRLEMSRRRLGFFLLGDKP